MLLHWTSHQSCKQHSNSNKEGKYQCRIYWSSGSILWLEFSNELGVFSSGQTLERSSSQSKINVYIFRRQAVIRHCLGRDSTFLITSKFYFCTWILSLGLADLEEARGALCLRKVSQAWVLLWAGCTASVALEIWKSLPLEEASEWSGHIPHIWASPKVMQSWCNLKSGRFIGFALWSVRENPDKCSPQKKHTQIRSCCLLQCKRNEESKTLETFIVLFKPSPSK